MVDDKKLDKIQSTLDNEVHDHTAIVAKQILILERIAASEKLIASNTKAIAEMSKKLGGFAVIQRQIETVCMLLTMILKVIVGTLSFIVLSAAAWAVFQ